MRQLDYSSVKKDILRLCVFYSFTKCHIIKVYISVSTLAIASEGDFHGRKRESHWTRITECLTVVSELKTKLTILRCLVMRFSQRTSGMERSSLPFDIKIGIHSRRKCGDKQQKCHLYPLPVRTLGVPLLHEISLLAGCLNVS